MNLLNKYRSTKLFNMTNRPNSQKMMINTNNSMKIESHVIANNKGSTPWNKAVVSINEDQNL